LQQIPPFAKPIHRSTTASRVCLRSVAVFAAPVLLLMAGCSIGRVAATSANATFSISPGTAQLDTNCTGCNSATALGSAALQFSATLAAGGPASVTWSIYGGDAVSGPGKMTSAGQYSPPTYLTADRVQVLVTATLNGNPAIAATSILTITPGFLQPLSPENAAVAAGGSVTVTAYLAEAGGAAGINFSLADSANGSGGGVGTLGQTSCQHDRQSFTSCTVTYAAPAVVAANGATYVVATVGTSASRTAAALLLNSFGVSSNPAAHQSLMPLALQLGSSGGNINDYGTSGNQIVNCCSGTLGALIEDSTHRQYLLSNNHVLARSDQASVGEAIVQPGLIDNNCTPNGTGISTMATLTGWLPLSSHSTNADAAIAAVALRSIDTTGSILELGTRQPDGSLASAPPGISSTNGKGETAALEMKIAKSGRTTGLTCGSITAVDLDVTVDYFHDCAETQPYLTKTFTDQLAVSGNSFSDAGDSGALLVDTTNAEPVGLFFAGGNDADGVSQGVASPAPEVLAELSAQLNGGSSSYSFVGAADHPVSCLNYGSNTVAATQARSLTAQQMAIARQAVIEARALVNPLAGILGVATGKSNDHPGEAAIVFYTDQAMTPGIPATIGGVRTMAIPTTAHTFSAGLTPLNAALSDSGGQYLSGAITAPISVAGLNAAIAVKHQFARTLLRRDSGFFAVGVGQSLDNPREAALVLYVDRRHVANHLPQTIGGLRTRYVVMDRLHVTRSYASPAPSGLHCLPHAAPANPASVGLSGLFRPLALPTKF
jgi:hypothetical protein